MKKICLKPGRNCYIIVYVDQNRFRYYNYIKESDMKRIFLLLFFSCLLLSCDGAVGSAADVSIENKQAEVEELNDTFSFTITLRNNTEKEYDSLYVNLMVNAGTASEGKSFYVASFETTDMFYPGTTVEISKEYYSADFLSFTVGEITECRIQTIELINDLEGYDDTVTYTDNEGIIYQNY